MKKTVLFFIGTRPEAIKVAPLIKEFKDEGSFNVILGLSGQHSDLIYKALDDFNLKPDFDLEIHKAVSSIEDPMVLILKRLKEKYDAIKPDLVFVHGDTSTTFAGTLSSFYEKIPVAHIEAGLRSHNLMHPWPEEGNRKLVSMVASLHFAPTVSAVKNLLVESVPGEKIILTGNTVVDAIKIGMARIKEDLFLKQKVSFLESQFSKSKKRILLTGHRRENLGEGIYNVFDAVSELSRRDDVEIIFPMHPNPAIRKSIEKLLGEDHNVKIVNPFDYFEMLWMLSTTDLLITDSGGLQEEAPSFDVPVLVTREATERMEAIDAGIASLVGTDKKKILECANKSLGENIKSRKGLNPFGDGFASKRILDFTKFYLNGSCGNFKVNSSGFYNLVASEDNQVNKNEILNTL